MSVQDPTSERDLFVETDGHGSALKISEEIQRHAARCGFDWEQVDGVFAKVEEELAECRSALAAGDQGSRLFHEVGDLLFSCVNLARHLGVDPEAALQAANRRFVWRFNEIEQRLQAQGLAPGPETRALMETYWNEAKAAEQI